MKRLDDERRQREKERTQGRTACRKTRRISRRNKPKESSQPKRVHVKESQIKHAGMGLYILEDAAAGECVARYSGDPLSAKENARRKGGYRMQVHKNLFLDAADEKHFEARYINDCRGSRFKPNVRFAADYKTNVCSKTGFTRVRVFATPPSKQVKNFFWTTEQTTGWSIPPLPAHPKHHNQQSQVHLNHNQQP